MSAHLPGCPVYAANVTACPAECNCWPWTDANAEQPPPARLTLAVHMMLGGDLEYVRDDDDHVIEIRPKYLYR